MNALQHDPDLDLALARLVADGVVDTDQADRISSMRDAYALEHRSTAAAHGARRTVAALAGVGAGLVAVGLATALTTSWEDLTTTARLVCLLLPAAAVAAAGAVVAARTEGGLAALRTHDHRGRCALVGVALTAAGALLGVATWVALEPLMGSGSDLDTARLMLAGFAVGLVCCAGAAAVAPSAVPTLGSWAASLGTVVAGAFVLLDPATSTSNPWSHGDAVIAAQRDLIIVAAVVVLGVLWCSVLPRWTRPAQLATALGVATWFVPSFLAATEWTRITELRDALAGGGWCVEDPLMCSDDQWRAFTQAELDHAVALGWAGLVLLGALVVVGLTVFVLRGGWPWAAGGVLAATVLTQVVASRTLGAAGAFVLAGLVLAGLGGLLAVRGARRRAAEEAALAPDPGAADLTSGISARGTDGAGSSDADG